MIAAKEDGVVFDIQRFSVNDGPGIRTTVFLKGCPLNCLWCHNPESKKLCQQISLNVDKCIGCGKCADVCRNDVHSFNNNKHLMNFESCACCGECVQVCKCSALSVIGEVKTVEQVMEAVIKDRLYYANSGGGITISGGEPLLQPEFTSALLESSRKNEIHSCIETSGFASTSVFSKIAGLVDLVLLDYKLTNTNDHKKYVGQDNLLILENFRFLEKNNIPVILRCPIIPNINDSIEHFKGIARLSLSANVIGVEIMPYHDMGKVKAERIGSEYEISVSTVLQEQATAWRQELVNLGCKNVMGTQCP